MKKPTKLRLFMAIAGSLIFLIIALLKLENLGMITIPDIVSVRLYRQDQFSLGAPEYFSLPRSYSRLWDITMLPIFIGLLLWSWRHAAKESNLRILIFEALIIMIAAYCITSNMVALSFALVFATISGFIFGDWTAIFLSIGIGFVAGIVSFGLLFGLVISAISFSIFLGLKRIF